MARNPNRGSRSTKPKTYTDKNRPSGFYNVAGKGKRYWNAYTKSWSKSPLGSTDKVLSKASGRDVTATTQRIKKAASGGAKGGASSGSKGPLKIKRASNSGTPRSNANRRTTTSSSSNSAPKRPVGRNWSKGYGAKSDKPSTGDRSTWKNKQTTTEPTKPSPKPKTKPQTTKQVKASGGDPMHVWARANRKMIERVGTKKQREILANALKIKKKKKEQMSGTTGGYSKNIA